MARPKIAESSKLVSYPLRLTPRQVARVERLVSLTCNPVQETLRRAVDEFLDAQEKMHGLVSAPLAVSADPPAQPASPMQAAAIPPHLTATPPTIVPAAAFPLPNQGVPVGSGAFIPPHLTATPLAYPTSPTPVPATPHPMPTTITPDMVLDGLLLKLPESDSK